MQAALRDLHRVCPVVHFLGSYPRFDGTSSCAREGFEDSAYDMAVEWVRQLSSLIERPQ